MHINTVQHDFLLTIEFQQPTQKDIFLENSGYSSK